MATWYRNYRGKYHKTRSDWVRSGRAVCGADIRNPGWAYDPTHGTGDPGIPPTACKHCAKGKQ